MFIKTTFNSDLNHILICVNKCDSGTKCFVKAEHFVLRLIKSCFYEKELTVNVYQPYKENANIQIS